MYIKVLEYPGPVQSNRVAATNPCFCSFLAFVHVYELLPIEHGIFGEGVTNFNQSEARKHCFLASDWLKFETLPR